MAMLKITFLEHNSVNFIGHVIENTLECWLGYNKDLYMAQNQDLVINKLESIVRLRFKSLFPTKNYVQDVIRFDNEWTSQQLNLTAAKEAYDEFTSFKHSSKTWDQLIRPEEKQPLLMLLF